MIVGAGLSGLDAAYRLQTERSGKSYAILEEHNAIGGTWDLSRYPGIRSDSDMFTLVEYINDAARESEIERRIRWTSVGRFTVGGLTLKGRAVTDFEAPACTVSPILVRGSSE